MGTWSGQPFGNDGAADWAFELDEVSDWSFVEETLTAAAEHDEGLIDADVASSAIAAAEVVAHGLGRPTQVDAYTESVVSFLKRAGAPDTQLVPLAVSALAAATSDRSELADVWNESDPAEWTTSNKSIADALDAES